MEWAGIRLNRLECVFFKNPFELFYSVFTGICTGYDRIREAINNIFVLPFPKEGGVNHFLFVLRLPKKYWIVQLDFSL